VIQADLQQSIDFGVHVSSMSDLETIVSGFNVHVSTTFTTLDTKMSDEKQKKSKFADEAKARTAKAKQVYEQNVSNTNYTKFHEILDMVRGVLDENDALALRGEPLKASRIMLENVNYSVLALLKDEGFGIEFDIERRKSGAEPYVEGLFVSWESASK
jgi:hypothetical protein